VGSNPTAGTQCEAATPPRPDSVRSVPVKLGDVPTPALVVDRGAFDHNVATMTAAHPGPRLRPHVKAFKSTALARELAAAGHRTFCCATVREMEGMARAGLGDDLLLANEVLDATRLGAVAAETGARMTVAVDSPETVAAAAAGGVREVLVDVNVGLPRCGCDPADAGRIAELARAQGLAVRGVMGYEGHLMREPREQKAAAVEASMKQLIAARELTGGDIVSAGGTGTYDTNTWATEIQAGSYVLMDTEYVPHAPAFRHALALWTTVISVNPGGWAVVDAGLKALGMDHGDPTVVDVGDCWFVSDEHITFGTRAEQPVRVGDKVRVLPAHVDPTVALHERMLVVDGEDVIDTWDVDLRNW
jgi:D-serine deaminase-like pyridoxal phosphate-dependent protein